MELVSYLMDMPEAAVYESVNKADHLQLRLISPLHLSLAFRRKYGCWTTSINSSVTSNIP
jgi:hypothetical protein